MNTLGITKVPLVKNTIQQNGNSGTSSTISSVSALASGSKSLLSMKRTKNNISQSQEQIRARGSARTNITKNIIESSINNRDQSYQANAVLLSASKLHAFNQIIPSTELSVHHLFLFNTEMIAQC